MVEQGQMRRVQVMRVRFISANRSAILTERFITRKRVKDVMTRVAPIRF